MEVVGWFIGAGIGTVFTALYEGVKKLAGRPTKFIAQLEALELTLESFDLEVIHQIGRHNEAMGLPNEDVKALEEELNKGVRIIGELSDACVWNRIDSRHTSELVQLNRSLNILERRLKLQSMRDVKETRHMMQILLIRQTLNQEPGRDGYMSLLSTTRLLDIAPQEALHHIVALDQVRNTVSTSTDLRQFHGNGDIQGNFPTTRLPDYAPQEALHHTVTLDPVWNVASTSADHQQFHGSDEIQGNFSTTRLPDYAPQEALHYTVTLDPVTNVASTSTDLQQFHASDEIQVTYFYAEENITELLKILIVISRKSRQFKDSTNGLKDSIQRILHVIKKVKSSPTILKFQHDLLLETIRAGHELANKVLASSRFNFYKNRRYARKMEKIEKTVTNYILLPLETIRAGHELEEKIENIRAGRELMEKIENMHELIEKKIHELIEKNEDTITNYIPSASVYACGESNL